MRSAIAAGKQNGFCNPYSKIKSFSLPSHSVGLLDSLLSLPLSHLPLSFPSLIPLTYPLSLSVFIFSVLYPFYSLIYSHYFYSSSYFFLSSLSTSSSATPPSLRIIFFPSLSRLPPTFLSTLSFLIYA